MKIFNKALKRAQEGDTEDLYNGSIVYIYVLAFLAFVEVLHRAIDVYKAHEGMTNSYTEENGER